MHACHAYSDRWGGKSRDHTMGGGGNHIFMILISYYRKTDREKRKREKEKERQREREKERARERNRHIYNGRFTLPPIAINGQYTESLQKTYWTLLDTL